MKKVFYIVFFANFAFFSSLAMAKDELKEICLRNMQEPQVSVSTSYGTIRYDHSKNKRSITRMHRNKYKGKIAGGKILNGLSTFEHELNISFEIKKQKLASGVICAYPTKIDLYFGVGEDPVIYIAKEYAKGSCMYDLVLRHEQTHQQINQSVLEYYLPIIKERFLDVVKHHAIASQKRDINLTLAKNELRERYLQVLNPLIDEMKAETDAEQAKLDNDKNYNYEAKLCLGK